MSGIVLLTFSPHRDLKCWGQHVSIKQGDEPVEALCIARKYDSTIKAACFVLPLDNLFKFTAPENAEEEFALVQSCRGMAAVLECPTDSKSLMRLAMYVQDNIDKVFDLKPYDGKGRVVGEVEGQLNGESFTSEVTVH